MGSLMICDDEVFVGICSDGFNSPEAQAACRQLGFVDGVSNGDTFANGAPVSNQRFRCSMGDIAITDCTVTMDSTCNSGRIQSIRCSNEFISYLPLNYAGAVQESFMLGAGIGALNIPFDQFIPIGTELFDSGVIYAAGIMSFGDLEILPANLYDIDQSMFSVLYPFLETASNVETSARIQHLIDHPTSPNLEVLSRFIQERTMSNFTAQFMVLVQWVFDDVFTVQAAVVTDYYSSHAVYIYRCNEEFNVSAEIGVSIASGNQNFFRYSNTPFTSRLACINNEEGFDFYNLYYELFNNNSQEMMSNSMPPTGSCIDRGFLGSSCCDAFEDPTESCAVQIPGGDTCFCDALCFMRNDCCNDIETILRNGIQPCIPLCEDGIINQVDGTVYPVGAVGVCNNGYFRFISEEGTPTQMSINQNLSCLQLRNQLQDDFSQLDTSTYNLTTYPIYRETLTCTGLENRIQDCAFEEDVETTTDAGNLLTVNCLESSLPNCTNGDVRLVSSTLIRGELDTQGVVEMCAIGQWRRACVPSFSPTLLSALCGFLNFTVNNPDALLLDEDIMFGVLELDCGGSVANISDCTFGLATCESNQVLALSCDDVNDLAAAESSVQLPTYALVAIILGCIIVTVCVISIAMALLIGWKRKMSRVALISAVLKEKEIALNDRESKRYVSEFPFNKTRAESMASVHLLDEISDDLIVPSEQLRLLDCVGQGEFGLVYKAHYLTGKNADYVAVKTLKGVFDKQEIDDMLKESMFMKKLDHPNVMQLLGICLDAGSAPYIVLPFMSGGSLLSYLKKNRSELLHPGEPNTDAEEIEVKLLSMCLQIAKGMEYLAGENLVHRDLAARNCMIDHEGTIKVSDFGLSTGLYEKMYFRQEKSDGVKLPIKWMAIESIEDGIFSEKSDVWSYGITCWEIFSGGKTPFGGITPFSIPKLLLEGHRPDRPFNTACSSKTYNELMINCWAQAPNDRPRFSELVKILDETLTSLAGYMDFNAFNLAVNNMDGMKTPNDTDDEVEDK